MGKDPSWQRIKAIFNAALELAPDDRQRYLDEACADDSALRPEVESLLAASDTVLPWLEGPALRVAASWMGEGAAGPFESPGRLGDYRVLREVEFQRQLGLSGTPLSSNRSHFRPGSRVRPAGLPR